MGKSSNQKIKSYQFFNKRSLPKTVQKFWEKLELSNFDPEDIWHNIFTIYDKLAKCWNYSDSHFKRYWADQLIKEVGLMLWNDIYNKNLRTREAEKLANETQRTFENKFK